MLHTSRRFSKSLRSLLAALAVAVPAALALTACGGGGGSSSDSVPTAAVPQTIIEAHLDTVAAQDGGGTTAVAQYEDTNGTKWGFYNMANRFAATQIGTTKGTVFQITVPGMVHHITLVSDGEGGNEYALLSMGDKGIGVVDVTAPSAMHLLGTATVHFELTGINYAEGGGDVVLDQTISGNGPVMDMVTDGTTLWVADSAYGIHKTALSNLLLGPLDGSPLTVEAEVSTVQYAGENPWGGPLSLKLHVDENTGKVYLYAAEGFLGIAIYDADKLDRIGGYNLYTDASVTEDWFQGMDPKQAVHDSSWIDPVTGMPTYEQASYEIKEIWHNGVEGATPWADFDRYGAYYYNARALDLQTVSQSQGGQTKTIAYVAYSLGGLVAVDVTNPASPSYMGYVPAVPAHGPDEPTGQQAKSIFPHFGVGMLKEAGVVDVRVDKVTQKVYYSDHFAGLVVVDHADDPSHEWHGPDGQGNYKNDDKPNVPFWPDYEFVTSYDMKAHDDTEEESLPQFLYESPIALATGELSGHGGAMLLMPNMDPSAAGTVDVVQADGAGGVNFVDIKGLNAEQIADRFEVPVVLVSTNEVGATVDGAPGQAIAIGHTAGVTVSGSFLYVSDGPHGMSVWRIADDSGNPTDSIHLVANTLQDEYPEVNALGEEILPTPHAFGVGFNNDPNQAYVLSQSLGLRRVDVSAVTSRIAQVGAPALLRTTPSGIFEHSTETDEETEAGGNTGGIHGQDHAYGVAFAGPYAVVADGGNGLTIYNLNANPADGTGSHVVANIGSETGKPALGRAAAVALWVDPSTNHKYAIVAAGSSGVSVVDMTELADHGTVPGMTLVKTFQPIKLEEEDGETHVGFADGKSVDVKIVGDYAYFSYDSFGLVAYRLSDLVAPVPQGADPTKLYDPHTGTDYRPVAVGQFNLQSVPGYEALEGGAQYMTAQYFPAHTPLQDGSGRVYELNTPKLFFYVAYAEAGVIKLDWSDPAAPKLLQRQDTVGEAASTAIANGRVYVADGDGGLVVFK